MQVLTVDCANGVGAGKLKALAERLGGKLDMQLRNTGRDGGGLNDGCGADFVQKERAFPAGLDDRQNGARCVCCLTFLPEQGFGASRLPSQRSCCVPPQEVLFLQQDKGFLQQDKGVQNVMQVCQLGRGCRQAGVLSGRARWRSPIA